MERKEDLTLTNKQMLVAQLRKEQEQNHILRKELENAKREQRFAERDALATIAMFNDKERKDKERVLNEIKIAQKDILVLFINYILKRKSVYMEYEELEELFFDFIDEAKL